MKTNKWTIMTFFVWAAVVVLGISALFPRKVKKPDLIYSPPQVVIVTPAPSVPTIQCGRIYATAICNDGTLSFSRNRKGACLGHGGVRQLYPITCQYYYGTQPWQNYKR